MAGICDTASIYTLDTYHSVESTGSRECLLHERPRMSLEASPVELDTQLAERELLGIMAQQTRAQGGAMAEQRVVLSLGKQRSMGLARVASAVNRMGRLRYANQDCVSIHERRARDMEGVMRRLDRMTVGALADRQRYTPPASPNANTLVLE
ncbi:hypothetical protein EC988_004630 [Linderina pennispora]|nr:hypothetical protein EC988_004630 [Linderina pennispora]